MGYRKSGDNVMKNSEILLLLLLLFPLPFMLYCMMIFIVVVAVFLCGLKFYLSLAYTYKYDRTSSIYICEIEHLFLMSKVVKLKIVGGNALHTRLLVSLGNIIFNKFKF